MSLAVHLQALVTFELRYATALQRISNTGLAFSPTQNLPSYFGPDKLNFVLLNNAFNQPFSMEVLWSIPSLAKDYYCNYYDYCWNRIYYFFFKNLHKHSLVINIRKAIKEKEGKKR